MKNKRLKLHILAMRDSIVVVSAIVVAATILWLGYNIAIRLMVQSEAFYAAQERLISYNQNHITYETKQIGE